MIFDLAHAVGKHMRARKFPGPVTYGPERAKREGFASGIVFELDREGGDQITPPQGWKAPPGSPRVPYFRHVGGVVTIYARSSRHGAGVHDHEDEARKIADGVLCAMNHICIANKFPLVITACRMLGEDDQDNRDRPAEHSRTAPGAAQEIRFRIASLVRDVDYTGEGPLTGTVEAVAPPTITAPGFPDYDPSEP